MSGKPSLQTLEAAASWYVTLCEQGDAAREAHRQWLQSDPAHALAWARVTRLQATLGGLDGGIAKAALSGAQAQRRQVLKVLALLLAAGGSAALGLPYSPWRNTLADLHTGVGERRHVTLADGSRVVLNTDTALDVQFDAQQRHLRLRRGEVLIETAADSRPFRVQTAVGSLQALGTRFIVRSDEAGTQLSVFEHAVQVSPLAAAGLRVEAGQQLLFSATQVQPMLALAAGADAWLRGQLIVADWRLDAFIAELARYRPGRLVCDEQAAGLRISGIFQVDDSDAVLANLSGTLPIRVRWISRWWGRVERLQPVA
ncbi:FecR domain-containing protein [Pseudomonas cremoricolorata]|uniref:FecR domain-containing protein n=1 Tax=Pseudomonas cremoricolorata TaxID=157783 RepID=UPI00040F24CB|nr:FecR domain-containing protein [Pseudomonas cremoricolorata]